MPKSRLKTALVDRISKSMSEYLWLMEKHSDKVRSLPDFMDLYNTGAEKWSQLNLMQPPRGDEQKRKEYFDFCDKLCYGEPHTPQDHIMVVFAAWAAAQVLIDQDMLELNQQEIITVHKNAHDYMLQQYMESNKGLPSVTPPLSDLPSHFQQAFYLNATQSTGPGDHLLDQVIQYKDRTGRIRQCTVNDCGTSRMRGDWFMITHADDGEEVMITSSDMNDIIERKF